MDKLESLFLLKLLNSVQKTFKILAFQFCSNKIWSNIHIDYEFEHVKLRGSAELSLDD